MNRVEDRIDHLGKSFVDLSKAIAFSTRALIVTFAIGFVVTKI
jgi:hypothetical protein